MADLEDKKELDRYQGDGKTKAPGAPTIYAVGVGGGGGNAINYMCKQDIKGVEFVAMNTDAQALRDCLAPTRLLLGPKLCKGLGAGGVAEVGEQAAEESVPEIEKIFDEHVDMVFVTAGMGGGTGTGAAPVVARVSKNRDILTVGIVTIPFFFEGMDKMESALEGAKQLKENVDALLMINNDRLSDVYPDIEWSAAFAKADDILAVASRSISDMVTTPAMINIDMRDVRSTLHNGKTAFISVGYGEGENRMTKAIQNALHSPLLCDTDILTARNVLFAFYISHDINPPYKMAEAAETNTLISEMNKKVKVIFGWGYDDTLGNQVKFTILASGFDMTIDHTPAKRIESAGIKAEATKEEVDNTKVSLTQAYGEDKVAGLLRKFETQNYYILALDQLDSNEAIELVESSPTYKRDKREVAAAKSSIVAPIAEPVNKNAGGTNEINFSLDDR